MVKKIIPIKNDLVVLTTDTYGGPEVQRTSTHQSKPSFKYLNNTKAK